MSASHARGSSRLLRDQRGAVLVEFIVAFVPMLITFFCFTQYAHLATASLVMKHAAMVAARDAAVAQGPCIPDHEAFGDEKDAATAALGPFASHVTVVESSTDYKGSDMFGSFTTTTTFQFTCDVPLGRMICPGGTWTRAYAVTFPHSGARYDDACSEQQSPLLPAPIAPANGTGFGGAGAGAVVGGGFGGGGGSAF